MRFIALLLICLACIPCLADECEKLALPSVTVKILESPVTLNTTYGYRSLTTIGSEIVHTGQQILGLTRGSAVVQITTSSPGFVDKTGRWECLSPQIKVSFGYRPMTMYVAREFPQGTCAYGEIHQHELRHVKTYQDHVQSIEKEISAALTQRFATDGPWRGPVGEKRIMLQKELDERWMQYIKRAMSRVDIAQALIDTPEEYARVADSCNGEIRKRTR